MGIIESVGFIPYNNINDDRNVSKVSKLPFVQLKDLNEKYDKKTIILISSYEFAYDIEKELKSYLAKIRDKELYAYGVYQIEADGRSLFSKIEGDEDTIMGLPVKQIKEYLKNFKWKNI